MLIVMQGAPGSGKSTLAKKLAKRYNAVACSTDDYHHVGGEYRFNVGRLAEFHQKNLDRAIFHMDWGRSVVVDNCNILNAHAAPYVKHAVARGIPVAFVRCEGRFENVHGVPPEKVEEMRAAMEELTVARCLSC